MGKWGVDTDDEVLKMFQSIILFLTKTSRNMAPVKKNSVCFFLWRGSIMTTNPNFTFTLI